MRSLITVVAVLGLVAACGKHADKGGGSKVIGSCDQRVMQQARPVQSCLEYVGNVWTKKEIQARCGLEGQTFIDGPCPTEGVVLSCLQEGGKPMEARMRMFGDLEQAKATCATVGTPM